MTRVTTRTLVEERQKIDEIVKEYLDRWQALALHCHEMEPRTKYDICVQNMTTRFQKYFISVKPNSFAQIAGVAQSAKVVMLWENKEREFYKQLSDTGKRKEAMTSYFQCKRRKEEDKRHIDRLNGSQLTSNPIQGT